MKILSFTNCPLQSNLGSGKTVINYTTGLKELGHSIEVMEPKNFELYQWFLRAKKFRQALGAWRIAIQKLQVQEYDLIEFYGDEFWLTIWQLSKHAKRPLLIAHTNGLELLDTLRRKTYISNTNSLYSWFSRQTHEHFSLMAFTYSDAFVSLCELDCHHVLDLGLYPSEKAVVVEPGLDQEFLSIPFSRHKQNRIAFTGHWTTRKGVDYLTKVITHVLTQKEDFFCDIYGTGESRDKIIAGFPNQLQERIVIHPRLSNQEMADNLAKAKVFFFPSQYEGFGIALAEAMACSCAAVTTKTGFGAGLINGEEALLCDFDDTEMMTRCLLTLLNNDELRTSIARKGWERVRTLQWEPNIRRLETIYKLWLADHQKNQPWA